MTTRNVPMADRYGDTIEIQYTVNSDGSLSPTGGGGGGGGGGVSASTSATVWIDPTSGTPVYYIRIENNDGSGNLTVAWTTPAGVTATPTVANLVPYEIYSLGNQQDASATSDGGAFSLIALTKRLLAKLTSGIGVTGTFWQATQPVSAASLPLPSGAATSALQTALNTALGSPFQAGGSIGNSTFGATQSGAWTVAVTGAYQATQPISAASLPLPSGAATSANQNVTVAGTSASSAQAVQGVTGGVAVTVMESDASLVSSTSQTSASVLFSQDTTGYNSISVQVTSAGTTCTITYEGSNDNTTWYSVIGIVPASQANTYASATNSLTAIVFPCAYRYFRARVSTYTSGTVTVVTYLRFSPVVIPNQLSVTGSLSMTSAASSNLQTLGMAVAPATPAAVQIKSSAGRLYSLMVGNSGASDVWVKLFNATSVTLGTTAATLNLYVPKGTSQNFVWSDIGAYFSTGIEYAVTGGISGTDNTSITASTVTVSYGYV